MPFQGNPNAGQPDPALLNLLFQQKAQREERAYKMQQDALAAQRQAQLDAAEEARKAELHQAKLLDLRVKTANALQSQEKQIGADQKTADQAKEQVAQQYPFVSTPGRQTPMGVEYGALPDQSIQNAYTQQQFNDQIQAPIDLRKAMLASNMAQVPGFENYGGSLGMQGLLAQAGQERIDQEALQKTLDEEARKKAESDRVARRDEGIAAAGERRRAKIAAEADTNKIKARETELQKLSNMIGDPKVTGQQRELAESQYRAIRAEADADLTRSQPPEAVTENRRRADENFEYDQVYDQSRSVTELIRRLEQGDTKSIGVEAWASEVLGNFKNIVQTTSSVPFIDRYTASLDKVLNNTENTPEERQKIIDTYFSQANLDRVASGQLTEQEMQWWFMYSLNPDGRVSNMLAKDTQNNVQIIGPLVGPKLALSRLRAMANRQGQFLRRRRSYISKVDKSEAFDPIDGRRVASESLPMPTTAGPVAPAGAVPRMTPAERAKAISGAP